jgi:uncharacterized protein DUF3489
MTIFRIDADNNITALGPSQQIEKSGGENETFGNLQELTALAEKWSVARLVEILEQVPRCPASAAIHQPASGDQPDMEGPSRPCAEGDAETEPVAAKKPSSARKLPRPGRKERGGISKTTRVIALLRRPQGATLQAIMKATDWQTHSVRGFISGQLKKKLGLKVRSAKREGKRVYSIKPL